MPYYSARLHVVCIVDDGQINGSQEGYTCDYPSILFRATNEDAAFARALELGRQHETEYLVNLIAQWRASLLNTEALLSIRMRPTMSPTDIPHPQLAHSIFK